MKKRKRLSGISFPAWFTIALIALLSLAVRCIVHLLPLNETVISIISDISLSILSVAILDFFLNVSSEQKLVSSIVNSIQYDIIDNVDFCKLSKEEKANIIRRIYLSCFKSESSEGKSWYKNYIVEYCDCLSNDFLNTVSTSVYYSEYKRNVEIVLRNSDILVCIFYRIVICNPALEECKYRHDPMFRLEKEFNSYSINELMIDDEEIKPDVSGRKKPAHDNRMYYSGRKIEIDLLHKDKTIISQKVSYSTDYNQFFQTYWLHYPCKSFSLEAQITDQRTRKDTEYTLHWDFFGPLDRSQIARNGVVQTEFRMATSMIKNLPKGSGFVLCLGSREFTQK